MIIDTNKKIRKTARVGSNSESIAIYHKSTHFGKQKFLSLTNIKILFQITFSNDKNNPSKLCGSQNNFQWSRPASTMQVVQLNPLIPTILWEAIQKKRLSYLPTKLLWERWRCRQEKASCTIDNHINFTYSFSICYPFLNFALILSSLIDFFKGIVSSFLFADFSLTQPDFISRSTSFIDVTPGRRNSKLYPNSDSFIVYDISLSV